jgi:hypothetical protein
MGQSVSKKACGKKARSDTIDRQITEGSKRVKAIDPAGFCAHMLMPAAA